MASRWQRGVKLPASFNRLNSMVLLDPLGAPRQEGIRQGQHGAARAQREYREACRSQRQKSCRRAPVHRNAARELCGESCCLASPSLGMGAGGRGRGRTGHGARACGRRRGNLR